MLFRSTLPKHPALGHLASIAATSAADLVGVEVHAAGVAHVSYGAKLGALSNGD